ncbi:MAG: hypothetical protein BGO41_05865 [Clostridiales bacterium 38-18]|nr:MAG: hypothetical protein BGO41_05865 [Clostridiales bacterium 38-18]
MKSVVVDTHNDTLMKLVNEATLEPEIDIAFETNFHIDLPKMRQGNVDIAYFAAFSEDGSDSKLAQHRICASFNALSQLEMHSFDSFEIYRGRKQLEKALLSDKRVGVRTIEGAYSLTEDNYQYLTRQYAHLGVQAIAPVWNYSNAIGEGTLEAYQDGTKTQGGLTPMGYEFIKEMDKLGIMIDVSHMNEKTFWDVVSTSNEPIIASHSGAYSIKNHIRNLKDDQLIAIQRSGGVVNVVFCRYFLGDENGNLETLLDHIEYISNLIGYEYVGLGSDFDGATMPIGLEDISKVPLIREGLEKRGFKNEMIEAIMGNNNLRLLRHFDQKMNVCQLVEQQCYSIMQEQTSQIVIRVDKSIELNQRHFCIIVDGDPSQAIIHGEEACIRSEKRYENDDRYHLLSILDLDSDTLIFSDVFRFK